MNDLEFGSAVETHAELAAATAMRNTALERHVIRAASFVGSDGRPRGIQMPAFAGKVAAMGVQELEDVVVFWLVGAVGVRIAEG
jgi:hypothetical protein